jgi:hypothetical protein
MDEVFAEYESNVLSPLKKCKSVDESTLKASSSSRVRIAIEKSLYKSEKGIDSSIADRFKLASEYHRANLVILNPYR